MIRVAMVSYWHVHERDYTREALQHPDVQIAAVWDEVPERGRAEATRLGVPFYERLDELFSTPNIDGVVIGTPTTMHRDVMIAAAQAHKHIFTEKVLAPTLHECQEILAAVQQHGVKLMVSLPRLYAGYTQAIQAILEGKLLGMLTQTRVRLSHNGAIATADNPNGWLPAHFFNREQCAGGAMIDLGCHPMYLTRLFLGMPQSVSASYGYVTGREVEDNAVVTLRYANGALGIVEAGFVNRFSPFTIEVHGTEGSLFYSQIDSSLQVRSLQLESGQRWISWRDIPADAPSPFRQWITHIQQNTTAAANIQMALDLSQLMEAANRSAVTNREMKVHDN
jgi:1,5-anhydro-D-fructose reductase (1,5-anhydro-D-mannitol-forming)